MTTTDYAVEYRIRGQRAWQRMSGRRASARAACAFGKRIVPESFYETRIVEIVTRERIVALGSQ